MPIPRRQLAEIAARYRLEPQLRDIYVEGRADKRAIDCALQGHQGTVAVYEIDTVEICDITLDKYNLTRGNKQEVIALAKELNLSDESLVKFYVDKDMDHVFESMEVVSGLVYSRWCDLYNAVIDDECLDSLLRSVADVKCNNISELIDSIKSVVITIYAFRVVMRSCGYDRKLPNIRRCLSKSANGVRVDMKMLVGRCQALPDSPENIVAKVKCHIERFSDWDYRDACRSHDTIEVLSFAITQFKGNRKIADCIDSLLIMFIPARSSEILDGLLT